MVYDPFTDSLYTAIKGKGAHKNGNKITVNAYALNDMHSIGNYDMWAGAGYDISAIIQELRHQTYFVSIGSVVRACMCVASGEFSLAVFPGTKHKHYDIAAAKIIVEEAGGKVTDLFGNEQSYDRAINGAVVSNGKVHAEVVETIKKYLGE